MPTYADPAIVKQKAGVEPNDINNVQNTSDLDALISALNERASDRIEAFCGRDFLEHTGTTAVIDGDDRQTIRIKRARVTSGDDGALYPLINVSEIKENDNVVDSSDYRIKPGPGRYNSGIIERQQRRWPEGWENIEVTFDWGFSSVPPEVEAVAEDLVVGALLDASHNESAEGVESISMDGFSVSYRDPMKLDKEDKERLKPFRRLATA